MQLTTIRIDKPDTTNFILGQTPEFRREVQCLSALNLLDFPFPGAAFASPKSSGRRRRRKENLAFPW